MWTTIGDIFIHNTGKALNASNNEGILMDYITTSNLYWDKFDLAVVKQMLFTDTEIEKCTIKYGDLLVCEGGDIGRAAIWTYDYEIRIQNHIHRLRGFCNISHRFYYYIFLLYKMLNLIGGKGVAIQGLSSNDLHKLVVPLPPIKEQCRIVSIIELWFSVIDRVEQEKIDLWNVIKQTKSKILDLSIHGKLVPQDPNDKPAVDLLQRINPNFKPCDNAHYPSGWVQCSLNDIFNLTMGQSPTGDSINNTEGIEFHQGKIFFTDIYISKSNIYTSNPTKIAERESLLLCVRAPVGIVNISNRDICIGRGLCALQPKGGNLRFYFYLLKTMQDEFEQQATGSTFKAISGNIIKNTKIILPPKHEQNRIVKRIEELFVILDKIKESLEA